MSEAIASLNAHAGELLLLLNLGIAGLLAALLFQTMGLRQERRSQAGQLAEQLGRAQTGLQKINSSVIAQTNELKERLGMLGPALQQAEQMVREATSFTTEFKAVRTELQQLDEKLTAMSDTVATAVSSLSSQPEAEQLARLDEQVGTLTRTLNETAQTQRSVAAGLQAGLQAVVGGQAQAVTELRSLATGHGQSTRELRSAMERDLRQLENRLRELTEKLLSESAQLRTRIDSDTRAMLAAPARQTAPAQKPAPPPGLDEDTRKEFRKLAERIDGLQGRLEEIIRL